MSEATAKFHIAPDKESLTRVSGSLHALAAARQSRLDSQSSILATLSRRLNNLHGQYTYEEERHDAGRHAAEMLKMDTEKFRVAKGVHDAEVEGERLSGELAALRQQLATLEREGVEGGKRGEREGDDEVVLKLQFYRSLGIDAVRDAETGGFKRAVIRNAERGDVNVVELDGKLSERERVDAFWESL
jgi:kinetochore protein Spc24